MKLDLYTRLFGKVLYLAEKVNKKINLDFYYEMPVCCSNCSHAYVIYIKKGVYKEDAKKYIKCSHCGCKIK